MRRKPSWATLKKAANERILIIDGAMGTMIQQHKLGESHYRGERFQDHSKDVKGNNDLLVLTQPEIIEEIHSKYLACERRHHRNQYVQRAAHLDGRLSDAGSGL